MDTDTRNTYQRNVILEELKKLKSHPTAQELYKIVQQRIPNISLGTVYRNLGKLSRWGKILKLDVAGEEKRYDGNTENHYHLRCYSCGCVVDLDLPQFKDILKFMKGCNDYNITDYSLEFTGHCQKCNKGKKEEVDVN